MSNLDFQSINKTTEGNYAEYNSLFVAPVIEEIVWFDVSVNDSKLVDVSQGLQQVIDVESNLFKAHWANDVLTNKVNAETKHNNNNDNYDANNLNL